MRKKKLNIDQRIIGGVLRTAREERGLSYEELAEVVCLRKWHIKELEESDTFFTFYTMVIKIHAAKRVGKYLNLEESDYLETKTLPS
ncbi:helix-turn-helix domain-containing protein [Polynucleobacter bastaniensis]|uniref:helix-turn-helix domain-containing protein n=1 Tax=Polynucleobacter bastaniensis TaxID=2081039 RepID=UPI001C0E0E98|nr:helix-turn-helix domain-containing protein [Polynucleobacter bastaniensis]MBU3596984.1 helix-turn-helix domain-containing protein [Polynucleobacter bastaniensis]